MWLIDWGPPGWVPISIRSQHFGAAFSFQSSHVSVCYASNEYSYVRVPSFNRGESSARTLFHQGRRRALSEAEIKETQQWRLIVGNNTIVGNAGGMLVYIQQSNSPLSLSSTICWSLKIRSIKLLYGQSTRTHAHFQSRIASTIVNSMDGCIT
jgi:hypothetical protein